MEQKVSNKIKAFNYIFTLFILIYHSRFLDGFNIVFKSEFDENILELFLSTTYQLCRLAMTAFFMISAFLFYFNINSSKEAIHKMKKRLKTLLIPYCVWIAITIIFQLIVLHEHPFYSLNSFINAIFFVPVDGALWYLLALLLLMIPAPLIIKLKNKPIKSTIFFLISMAIIYMYNHGVIPNLIDTANWEWYTYMSYYFSAYVVGVYLGLIFSDKVSNENYNIKFSIVVAILLLILIIVNLLIKTNVILSNLNYIYILSIMIIWLILPSCIFKKRLNIFNSSFFIYVTHMPISILIINKLTKIILNGATICGYQMVLIKLIQVTIIAIISHFIVLLAKKFLPEKVNSIIFGGRI